MAVSTVAIAPLKSPITLPRNSSVRAVSASWAWIVIVGPPRVVVAATIPMGRHPVVIGPSTPGPVSGS